MSKKKRKIPLAYNDAKSAKVGETIKCACCGKSFIKRTYQQVFCCDKCKNDFWNDRGDRHSKGYYKKYNELHHERIERMSMYEMCNGFDNFADFCASEESKYDGY